MAKFDADKLVSKVTVEEVIKIRENLIGLFNMEVKAKEVYFQELRRFDGREFETIKWLADQETRHIQIIESVLSKANIIVKEQRLVAQKFGSDPVEIIKYDLAFEDVAVKAYANAAKNTTGALSELLSGLMDEELIHVEKLRTYLPSKK